MSSSPCPWSCWSKSPVHPGAERARRSSCSAGRTVEPARWRAAWGDFSAQWTEGYAWRMPEPGRGPLSQCPAAARCPRSGRRSSPTNEAFLTTVNTPLVSGSSGFGLQQEPPRGGDKEKKILACGLKVPPEPSRGDTTKMKRHLRTSIPPPHASSREALSLWGLTPPPAAACSGSLLALDLLRALLLEVGA